MSVNNEEKKPYELIREWKFQILNELVANFKIYVDTCSLLSDNCANTFLRDLYKILIYQNCKIYLPDTVIREVEEKKENVNYNSAKDILEKYRREKIIEILPSEDYKIPDHFFIVQFFRTYCQENFCLFSQDKDLVNDIFQGKLASVDSPYFKAFIHLNKRSGYPYFSDPQSMVPKERGFLAFAKSDNSPVILEDVD